MANRDSERNTAASESRLREIYKRKGESQYHQGVIDDRGSIGYIQNLGGGRGMGKPIG